MSNSHTLTCLINEHACLTFFTFLKTISLFSRSFFRKFGPYVLACSFIRQVRISTYTQRWINAAKRQNIALIFSLFSGRRFVRRLFELRTVWFWQWWLLWWKSRTLFLHKMWMFGSGLLTFLMVQKNLSNNSIPIA